jgi:hypothetical protein
MFSNLLEWGRKLWRGLVEGLAASVPPFYRIVLDAWRVPTEEERRKAGARQDSQNTSAKS